MLIRQLCAAPLFRGLTEEEIIRFQDAAEQITCRAGDVLMDSGADADCLYYVVSGEITVKVLDAQLVPTMVSVLGHGGMAGWSALIPPHKATAMLTALTDATLVRINGTRVRETCRRHPDLGLRVVINVSAIICQRLNEARARLAIALEHTRR
jgi:CRP-like cAMP-binding protein